MIFRKRFDDSEFLEDLKQGTLFLKELRELPKTEGEIARDLYFSKLNQKVKFHLLPHKTKVEIRNKFKVAFDFLGEKLK